MSVFPISDYIGKIRNKSKRQYALAYYNHLVSSGQEPEYKDFAISYMAAQAVRMNINDMNRDAR